MCSVYYRPHIKGPIHRKTHTTQLYNSPSGLLQETTKRLDRYILPTHAVRLEGGIDDANLFGQKQARGGILLPGDQIPNHPRSLPVPPLQLRRRRRQLLGAQPRRVVLPRLGLVVHLLDGDPGGGGGLLPVLSRCRRRAPSARLGRLLLGLFLLGRGRSGPSSGAGGWVRGRHGDETVRQIDDE